MISPKRKHRCAPLHNVDFLSLPVTSKVLEATGALANLEEVQTLLAPFDSLTEFLQYVSLAQEDTKAQAEALIFAPFFIPSVP